MKNDPGLFTDSTGEGMAGAEDVKLDTQREIGTVYNGSTGCKACGMILNPVQSLHTELCSSCSRRKLDTRVKNRMAE
jgi:hypothetical protein